MMFALLTAFMSMACVAIPLVAQDVTVMPPALFDLPNQPDTPAKLLQKWSPKSAKEMHATTEEPRYIIYKLHINEKGMVTSMNESYSYAPGFSKESLRDIRPPSRPQCAPAKKKGKPVNSLLWTSVIYNPASASKKSVDATPRLLSIALIPVTKKQYDAFPKGSRFVRGSIEIDTTGAAKNLKLESGASFAQNVRPDIERSLAKWKFAPARKDGKPVSATLTLGFLVTLSPSEDEYLQQSSATKRGR